jgi:hypothetical protein
MEALGRVLIQIRSTQGTRFSGFLLASSRQKRSADSPRTGRGIRNSFDRKLVLGEYVRYRT